MAKAALLALGLAAAAEPAFFLREGDGCLLFVDDGSLSAGDPSSMVREARDRCRKGDTIRLVLSRGSRVPSAAFLAHICEGAVIPDPDHPHPWSASCIYRGPPPVP